MHQEELGTNRNCNCDMAFTFCAGQNRISSFTTLVSATYSCYPCHPWVCAVAEGGRRHTTTGDYAFTTLNEGSLEVSVVLRGQTLLSLQDHLYLWIIPPSPSASSSLLQVHTQLLIRWVLGGSRRNETHPLLKCCIKLSLNKPSANLKKFEFIAA